MNLRIALLAIMVCAAGIALAQEAYCVDDTDDKVGAYRADLAKVACPTGTTGVELATIAAAYDGDIIQGGTWDGTTYTAPASELPPATDVGRLQAAARMIYEALLEWSEGLADVSANYPQAWVSLGHDLLTYAHRGVRGVMMSSEWTVAQRETFATQMAAGAADVKSPHEFFIAMEQSGEVGEDDIVDPNDRDDKRVLWVNPDTGSRVNLHDWDSLAVDKELTEDDDTTTVLARMVAETSDLADYIDGAWIDDISS